MNTLKILFFLPIPNPFSGAAWTRIVFFGQYFSSKGHDVSIGGVFSTKTLGNAGIKKWNGLRLYNITPMISLLNCFCLLFNIISATFSLIVLMIWLRPQLVIISVPNGECAVGAYLVARMFRKHIVIDYRDLWEDYNINRIKSKVDKKFYRVLKKFMSRCYRDSNLVVTVTEPLALDLLSRGVKDVKILTNGADTNIFKPYNKKTIRMKLEFGESDFILIYDGVIGSYYRIDILIASFRKLMAKIKNARLVLVGDGEYVKKLIEISREMGLDNHVHYLGPITDKEELAEILSAADVGVIPRSGDLIFNSALPAKCFEYFACGLPVVATVHRDSILGKLITDNKIGLISEPEEVDSLVDVLQKIHADKAFRDTAGERAHSLVEEKFNRNKIAKEFLESLVLINGND